MTVPEFTQKRILFVGGLFDEGLRRQVDKMSVNGTQAAADVLQWGYVDGIEDLGNFQLTIVSAPFVGSYPKRYKQMIVKSREFKHGPTGRNSVIGFINLPLIKHLWRAIALSRAVKTWIDEEDGDAFIIGYSLSIDILWALVAASRSSKRVTTAAVVPDLPEFMNTTESANGLYLILKGIESRLVRRLLGEASLMIILTKQMRDRLPNIPSIVIEGIALPLEIEHGRRRALDGSVTKASRTIMYAGTLNSRYGVLSLCEAFMALEDANLRLVLCGSGDSTEKIQKFACKDPRIQYLGQRPRREITQLEAQADILVNPRTNSQSFSAFSFPSKILEYLSTGRPVLCYKLDGIPDEYDEYLEYVEGDSPESLKQGLLRMLEKSDRELHSLGERGRSFVVSRKNPGQRMKELLDFMVLIHARGADGEPCEKGGGSF